MASHAGCILGADLFASIADQRTAQTAVLAPDQDTQNARSEHGCGCTGVAGVPGRSGRSRAGRVY
jgi:hypothetical protein